MAVQCAVREPDYGNHGFAILLILLILSKNDQCVLILNRLI
jgi:hypothetical protein